MKKHSHRLLWTAAVVLLAAVMLGTAVMALGIPAGLRVSRLLSELLSSETLDARVSLRVDQMQAETELFRRPNGDFSVTGCEVSGITLYYAQNRLIFDNGQAYDLEDTVSLDPNQLSLLLKFLPLAGVRREDAADGERYLLEPDLVKLQAAAGELEGLEHLRAVFTEREDRLAEIDLEVTYKGTSCTAALELLPQTERRIPDEVLSAAAAPQVPSIRVLMPLVNALQQLSAQNPMGAELWVNADCGPIKLTDTMMLYGTDQGVYLERKGKLEELSDLELSSDAMIALGYEFCRSGQLTQVDTSGSYSLVLPAEQVRSFCVEMVPEIADFPITYEDGALMLEVKENSLSWIRLDCAGQMPFLITTIPISLGIELTPVESESLILPDGIR